MTRRFSPPMEPETIQAIREARRKGLTLDEIRDSLGHEYSRDAIFDQVRDIPAPRDVTRQQVVQAVAAGMTYREAEEAFGVALKSVHRWCRHLNLRRTAAWKRERAA